MFIVCVRLVLVEKREISCHFLTPVQHISNTVDSGGGRSIIEGGGYIRIFVFCRNNLF